jgi:hypothetical protein
MQNGLCAWAALVRGKRGRKRRNGRIEARARVRYRRTWVVEVLGGWSEFTRIEVERKRAGTLACLIEQVHEYQLEARLQGARLNGCRLLLSSLLARSWCLQHVGGGTSAKRDARTCQAMMWAAIAIVNPLAPCSASLAAFVSFTRQQAHLRHLSDVVRRLLLLLPC